MALPALAIPAAARTVVAAVMKHGLPKARQMLGPTVDNVLNKLPREVLARIVPNLRKSGTATADDTPSKPATPPPPSNKARATKSDDDPYMRKGGKIKENAKMMDPMKMKMKNARKNMTQPKMAMGGMYGKKPEMMKGGMYKGKMHSYVGGGMVRDLETLRRK